MNFTTLSSRILSQTLHAQRCICQASLASSTVSATDLEVETHDPDYVEGAEEEQQTDDEYTDEYIEVETHMDSSSEETKKIEIENNRKARDEKTTAKQNIGSNADNLETMPQEGLSSDDEGKGAYKVDFMVKHYDQSFLQLQHFNSCTIYDIWKKYYIF